MLVRNTTPNQRVDAPSLNVCSKPTISHASVDYLELLITYGREVIFSTQKK